MTRQRECAVDIDVSQIPNVQRNELFDMAIVLHDYIFSMPGEEERYQEWLAKRNSKEAIA